MKIETNNYEQTLRMMMAGRFDAGIGSNVGLYFNAERAGDPNGEQLAPPLVLGEKHFFLHFRENRGCRNDRRCDGGDPTPAGRVARFAGSSRNTSAPCRPKVRNPGNDDSPAMPAEACLAVAATPRSGLSAQQCVSPLIAVGCRQAFCSRCAAGPAAHLRRHRRAVLPGRKREFPRVASASRATGA